ncbi:MAG: transposase [bacterium]|nr:transposase [bacterium]
MRLYQFQQWICQHLSVGTRVRIVTFWYVVSLLVSTRKHSLRHAAEVSGLHSSQFSRLLCHHEQAMADALAHLSKRQARRLVAALKTMKGLPWSIALLIDSTLQGRAGLHTENSQHFNHGCGYMIGHQWTNIALLLNDCLIPLPPIPFYTKKYCKEHKLRYKTEHDRIVEYLKALDLEEYVGAYTPESVVVIMDSGYDAKKIQNTILAKGWHFLGALKSTRGVKSPAQYANTPRSKGWTQISEFFRTHRRLGWQTISLPEKPGTTTRKEFRARHTRGWLKGVGPVNLVCSAWKKRRHGRRKYLACSDLRVTPKQVISGYRLRWRIEIFHKEVKQYLGFEDVAPTRFSSVETHVYLVYCAYIVLQTDIPGCPDTATTICEKQAYIQRVLEKRELSRIRQQLTQFGGLKHFMEELAERLAA